MSRRYETRERESVLTTIVHSHQTMKQLQFGFVRMLPSGWGRAAPSLRNSLIPGIDRSASLRVIADYADTVDPCPGERSTLLRQSGNAKLVCPSPPNAAPISENGI